MNLACQCRLADLLGGGHLRAERDVGVNLGHDEIVESFAPEADWLGRRAAVLDKQLRDASVGVNRQRLSAHTPNDPAGGHGRGRWPGQALEQCLAEQGAPPAGISHLECLLTHRGGVDDLRVDGAVHIRRRGAIQHWCPVEVDAPRPQALMIASHASMRNNCDGTFNIDNPAMRLLRESARLTRLRGGFR